MKTASIENYKEGQTQFIVFNRPEKYNCFGLQELDAIQQILKRAENDEEIRSVAFRGKGDKAFSTGADLNQFTALDQKGLIHWIKTGHEVFNAVAAFPKPTLALIQGYALGGGLELALACDFRLAGPGAVFGSPELRHGWLPGWGGIHRLNQLIGEANAKEVVFLAEKLDADAALNLGLVNRVFPKESWQEETTAWLAKLNQLDPDAFKMAKAVFSTHTKTGDQSIWYDVLSTLYSRSKE